MKALRKKTAAAAVMAATAVGLLVTPGQAQAASPSVKIMICNKWKALGGVDLVGLGPNGESEKDSADVYQNNCTAPGGNFKTDQTLDVTLWWADSQPGNPDRTSEKLRILPGATNGSVQTITYRY